MNQTFGQLLKQRDAELAEKRRLDDLTRQQERFGRMEEAGTLPTYEQWKQSFEKQKPWTPPGDPSFEKKRARARIDQEELALMEAENQLQELRQAVDDAKGTPYYEEEKRRLAFAERGVMMRRQQSARAREEYANLPEPPPPPKFADIRQQMIYEQAAARGMQQGFSPETVERALRAGKTLLFPN